MNGLRGSASRFWIAKLIGDAVGADTVTVRRHRVAVIDVVGDSRYRGSIRDAGGRRVVGHEVDGDCARLPSGVFDRAHARVTSGCAVADQNS